MCDLCMRSLRSVALFPLASLSTTPAPTGFSTPLLQVLLSPFPGLFCDFSLSRGRGWLLLSGPPKGQVSAGGPSQGQATQPRPLGALNLTPSDLRARRFRFVAGQEPAGMTGHLSRVSNIESWKVKRQPPEWDEIIADEITDRGLISKIYKQFI